MGPTGGRARRRRPAPHAAGAASGVHARELLARERSSGLRRGRVGGVLAEAPPLPSLVAGDLGRRRSRFIVAMARMGRARRRLNRERAATIPRSPGGLGVVGGVDVRPDRSRVPVHVRQSGGEAFSPRPRVVG